MIKRKKIRWHWYQYLRLAGQLSYFALTVFALIGRNFVLGFSLMGLALLGGAFYCGWLCPFGTVQEWLGRLGHWLLGGRRLSINPKVERWLVLSRYVLLVAGLTGLGVLGFLAFLSEPYQSFTGFIGGRTAYISTLAWAWLGLFLAASLVIDRPFCRYFCTEGARYGALSLLRVYSIRRDKTKCVDCGQCDAACPTQVQVSHSKHVRNAQCINCMQCVGACPVNGALRYGWALGREDKDRKTEKNDESKVVA